MSAMMKRIKTMWNACGRTAEGCKKAGMREFGEFKQGWLEVEAYWKEHPEARFQNYQP